MSISGTATSTGASNRRAIGRIHFLALAAAGLAVAGITVSSTFNDSGPAANRGKAPTEMSPRLTLPAIPASPALTYYIVGSQEQLQAVQARADLLAEDNELYAPNKQWKYSVLLASTPAEVDDAMGIVEDVKARWHAAGASGLEVNDLRERSANAANFTDWSAPSNLGAPVNTESLDACPFLSKDGKSLYFTSNREGGLDARDLWVSQRTRPDAAWGVPENLGSSVNTVASEFCPFVSTDGKHLFFVSDRADGVGMEDIYVSKRRDATDDLSWEQPVNLVAINSAFGDAGPWAFQDEVTEQSILYFNSNRPGGPGAGDIYGSVWSDNLVFSEPSLIPGVNTSANEALPTVRKDGLEVFFNSNRAGGLGGNDIWFAARQSQSDGWSSAENLSVINTSADELRAAISWEGSRMIFGSNRSGGLGGFDLYGSSRDKGP